VRRGTHRCLGIGFIARVCNPTAAIHPKEIQQSEITGSHCAGPKTVPCPGWHYVSVWWPRHGHEASRAALVLGRAFSVRARAGARAGLACLDIYMEGCTKRWF